MTPKNTSADVNESNEIQPSDLEAASGGQCYLKGYDMTGRPTGPVKPHVPGVPDERCEV
jgi:hypothetical protein